MSGWLSHWTEALWRNGLILIPLALAIVVVTRSVRCRPATRHALWLMTLLWLLMPPTLPSLTLPEREATSVMTPPTVSESHEWLAEDQGGKTASTASPPPLPVIVVRPVDKPFITLQEVNRVEVEAFDDGALEGSDSLTRHVDAPQGICPARSPGLLFTEHEPPFDEKSFIGEVLAEARPVVGATVPLWIALTSRVDWVPLLRMIERVARSCLPESAMIALRAGSARKFADVGGSSTGHHAIARVFADRGGHEHGDAGTRISHAQDPTKRSLRSFHDSVSSAASTEYGSGESEAARLDLSSDEILAVGATSDVAAGAASSTVAAPLLTAAVDQGVAWAAALMRVRDALGALPPIPAGIWLGGIVVVGVFGLTRLVLFRLRIRSARRADAAIVRLVREAASRMGLRSAPEVWIGEGFFSPMLWCGLKTRLVLPDALWAELDDVGRRAVIFHELAHIRRRDHRVIWIDLIVGCLYWWHPVVWFVRRQLHAEAETCCDAWVTTLLPRMRRGYAKALLKTREYLGNNQRPMPVLGIGISSPRAKRLARRITMVMTERTRPRLTVPGFMLVILMAGIGWVAVPAVQSCPTEEKEEKEAKVRDSAATKVEAGEKTTFEQYLADRELAAASGAARAVLVGDREEARRRMEDLERRIEELNAELERMEASLEDDADNDEDDVDEEEVERMRRVHREQREHRHVHGQASEAPRAPRAPRVPQAPRGPRPPRAPAAPGGPGAPCAPSAPCAPAAPCAPCAPCGPHAHGLFTPGPGWGDLAGGEKVWKDYNLSGGKLEDFTKLMSRHDVPIWVRPGGKKIGIQATERQHAIFNAFFQMIDPSPERVQAAPPERFGPGSGPGTGMGAGGGCAWTACDGPNACPLCRKAAEFKARASSLGDRAREEVDRVRSLYNDQAERIRVEALRQAEEVRQRIRAHARGARSEARAQEDLIRTLERQADRMREQAERMREREERLRDRAESIKERAGGGSGRGSAEAIEQHVRSLEESLRQLTHQAGALDVQAELLAGQGEFIRRQIEGLEEHARSLDERAESIDEAAQMLDEESEVSPELAEVLVALAADVERYASPMVQETLEGLDAMFDSVVHHVGTEVTSFVGELLPELANQVSADVARSLDEAVVREIEHQDGDEASGADHEEHVDDTSDDEKDDDQ